MDDLTLFITGSISAFVGLTVEKLLTKKIKSGTIRFLIAIAVAALTACIIAFLIKQ